MTINTQNKLILNYILIFSILALSSALFIQYILGYQPCNLCIIERIPYLAAIILISLILILNKYERIISIIISLFFILGTLISIYHVGIEQEIFSESFVCNLGNTNSNDISPEQLLKELKKITVSCKDVSFLFLGFSLASFNAVISFVLSGIMITIIKKYGKN